MTRAAGPRHGSFQADGEAALAELEQAWTDSGYHAFSADSGTWCAISSADEVLTANTPGELDHKIRAHWQGMQ